MLGDSGMKHFTVNPIAFWVAFLFLAAAILLIAEKVWGIR
jgi:hypothetical protein